MSDKRADESDDEGIDVNQVEMEELRRRDWLDRLLDGDR